MLPRSADAGHYEVLADYSKLCSNFERGCNDLSNTIERGLCLINNLLSCCLKESLQPRELPFGAPQTREF